MKTTLEAFYFDGITSASKKVEFHFDENIDNIRFFYLDGKEIVWYLNDISFDIFGTKSQEFYRFAYFKLLIVSSN